MAPFYKEATAKWVAGSAACCPRSTNQPLHLHTGTPLSPNPVPTPVCPTLPKHRRSKFLGGAAGQLEELSAARRRLLEQLGKLGGGAAGGDGDFAVEWPEALQDLLVLVGARCRRARPGAPVKSAGPAALGAR
jgi:hypothetical protein